MKNYSVPNKAIRSFLESERFLFEHPNIKDCGVIFPKGNTKNFLSQKEYKVTELDQNRHELSYTDIFQTQVCLMRADYDNIEAPLGSGNMNLESYDEPKKAIIKTPKIIKQVKRELKAGIDKETIKAKYFLNEEKYEDIINFKTVEEHTILYYFIESYDGVKERVDWYVSSKEAFGEDPIITYIYYLIPARSKFYE